MASLAMRLGENDDDDFELTGPEQAVFRRAEDQLNEPFEVDEEDPDFEDNDPHGVDAYDKAVAVGHRGFILAESDDLPTEDGYPDDLFADGADGSPADEGNDELDFDPAIDGEDLKQDEALANVEKEFERDMAELLRIIMKHRVNIVDVLGGTMSRDALPGRIKPSDFTIVLGNVGDVSEVLQDGTMHPLMEMLSEEAAIIKDDRAKKTAERTSEANERWNREMFESNVDQLNVMLSHHREVKERIAKTLEGRDLNVEWEQCEGQLKPGENQLQRKVDLNTRNEVKAYEGSDEGGWNMRLNVANYSRAQKERRERKLHKSTPRTLEGRQGAS